MSKENCGNCHKCVNELIDDALEKGMFDWRLIKMIVCPNCGNKRCPKASDHDLMCTGSNKPGQKGSIYE